MRPFRIDVAASKGGPLVILECPDCGWFWELDTPEELPRLIVRANEHSEVCKGSHPE